MTAKEIIGRRNNLKRALEGYDPQDIINGLHKEISNLRVEIMDLREENMKFKKKEGWGKMATKELKEKKRKQKEEREAINKERLKGEMKASIEIFIAAVSAIDHLDMDWSRESKSMILNTARAIQVFVEGSSDTLYRDLTGSRHRTT